MGGALSAHSEGEGKGTTLEFAIPLRRVTERGSEEETHCAGPVASADTSALLGVLPRRDDSDCVIVPSRFSVASSSRSSYASEETAAAEPLPASALPPAAPLIRVLVAEDDRLSQTLMRKLLPKMGFDPHIVDNGLCAVEAACAADGAQYELVIMDLQYVRTWLRLPCLVVH
jgi:hypothetical protein